MCCVLNLLRCAVVLTASLFNTKAFAGAWTLPKGKSQWMATSEYTVSHHYLDEHGKPLPNSRYAVQRETLFAEYGLTDSLTVFGQTSFEMRRMGYPRPYRYKGMGYSELGARHRVWQGYGVVTAVQGSLRIPPPETDNPLLWGQDNYDGDVRGLIGYSFTAFKRSFFTDLQAGYRARFGNPADELRIDATIGMHYSRRLMLMAQSFSAIPVGKAESQFVETEDHKVQISGVWSITPRWAVQMGSRSTVHGKNTFQELTYFGGVWLKF